MCVYLIVEVVWREHGVVDMTCRWQNQDPMLLLTVCQLSFLSALLVIGDDSAHLPWSKEPVREDVWEMF